VISWISTIFFFNFYRYDDYFFRKHIIPCCRRDIRTIIRPIQNSIQICAWRLDHLVDSIKIWFIISLTLQLRIYGHTILYWLLVSCNQVWANNIWSSKWLYENKLKLKRPSLVLRRPNLNLRRPTWGIKLIFSSSCFRSLLVHVVYLVALLVWMKIRLRLLFLLHVLSIR